MKKSVGSKKDQQITQSEQYAKNKLKTKTQEPWKNNKIHNIQVVRIPQGKKIVRVKNI